MRVRAASWLSGVVCVCIFVAMPAIAGMPGTDVYLSSVGRGGGAQGSFWYTTAWIHNPGSGPATFTISMLVRGQANPSPDQVTLTVGSGETMKLGDVLFDVFGLDAAVGALRFESADPIVVASRIFNLPGSDLAESQGQFFGGMPAELSISAGEYTDVPGITQPADGSFRCNFGVVETAGGAAEVRVTLYNRLGVELATRMYSVGPYQPIQENLSALLPGVAVDGGRLHVAVVSGAGSVLAFASMVGNGTASQDPSTLEMEYQASGQGPRSMYHSYLYMATGGDVTASWSKFRDYLTFDKQHEDSFIEVHLNSRAYGGVLNGGANGVQFQIRLDDQEADFENYGAIVSGETRAFLSIFAVFTDVPSGEHTIGVWARTFTGGASDVSLDSGGYGGGIIVKETW